MRQVLSTALVAVIVGALAGVTAGTMAQAPAESERVITQTGFNADKVDNEGVTRIRVTRVAGTVVTMPAGPGSEVRATVNCPASSIVVGGGAYGTNKEVSLSATYPLSATTWDVWATNNGASPHQITPYALCITIEPAALLETARKGKVTPAGKRK